MVTTAAPRSRCWRVTATGLHRADDGSWRLRSRTGVSIGIPGEIGTDAEWARALERMPEDLRAQFRLDG